MVGEAKARSRKNSEILASEAECIYCGALPNTVEHMPPKSIFRERFRPSGLVFACCEQCNHITRASDAAAGFFARLSPTHETDKLELEEAHRLLGTLARLAPQAVREVFDERKSTMIWAKGRSNVFGRMHSIKLDGPVTHALMTVFTAKFGMAMFREHIGRAMTKGGVFTQFYFNSGLTRQTAESTLSILPLFGELKQGKLRSAKQFNYRYNCDLKSILATFAAFHDNLFVRAIAVEEPGNYEFLNQEYNAAFVPFAGLPELAQSWNTSLPSKL